MSDIKIEQSTIRESQVGDFNSMINNINAEVEHIDEIKPQLDKLRIAIEESSVLGKYEKEDALNDLKEMVEKLSKPPDQQDKGGINHYWRKVIGVIKDIDPIILIAKNLAELLKLSLL
jgi:hypothetical protein